MFIFVVTCVQNHCMCTLWTFAPIFTQFTQWLRARPGRDWTPLQYDFLLYIVGKRLTIWLWYLKMQHCMVDKWEKCSPDLLCQVHVNFYSMYQFGSPLAVCNGYFEFLHLLPLGLQLLPFLLQTSSKLQQMLFHHLLFHFDFFRGLNDLLTEFLSFFFTLTNGQFDFVLSQKTIYNVHIFP